MLMGFPHKHLSYISLRCNTPTFSFGMWFFLSLAATHCKSQLFTFLKMILSFWISLSIMIEEKYISKFNILKPFRGLCQVNTYISTLWNICPIYTLLLSVLLHDTGLSDVAIVLTALQMYGGGERTTEERDTEGTNKRWWCGEYCGCLCVYYAPAWRHINRLYLETPRGGEVGCSLYHIPVAWPQWGVEAKKWSLQSLNWIDMWLQSGKCWIPSGICGIKERREFLVGNSSRQIAGLPRHRPLQGSRQPALISKGGVKEKSLLYPHTVPYIPLSLPRRHHQSTSHLSSPHNLQQDVPTCAFVSKCACIFVCKVCTQ